MAVSRLALVWLLVAVFFVTGSLGSGRHRHGHHHDDDDDKDKGDWAWGAAAGIAVIIGISVGGAAIFSLCAWLTCSLYSKCRKDKVGSMLIRVSGKGSVPPSWSSNLVFRPELMSGFGNVSDGFTRIGPSQLVRTKSGTKHSDGAKWAMGISTGKHLFEITWPWGARGEHATIGMAMEDAPIQSKGTTPLVGGNSKSWGLDIVKRRAVHNNRLIVPCPTDGSYVPDKFLMYIDMDVGTIGFGNDVTYWGEVITGLPTRGAPLYLMVGATKWQSELSVVYRGSAAEGGEGMSGMKPPHHLPPLYHVSAQGPSPPPIYSVKDGEMSNIQTMTHGIQPGAPPQGTEVDLPPPYSRPPSGCSMKGN